MAQEHQEYIQQKVNPLLENLVTQLLLERPEDIMPFMIKWLSEHAKTPAALALTEGVNELNAMKAELESLEAEVKMLENESEAAAAGAAQAADSTEDKPQKGESDEEDEDQDQVGEVEVPSQYARKYRKSVSAEAYGLWNKRVDFTPPVHVKSDEQKTKIRTMISRCFLFAALQPKDIEVVIDAMVKRECTRGTRLIEQGSDGDCLYVIESGQMDCFKNMDGHEQLVKECMNGQYFGELALLYNCPRAASVIAHCDSSLWQLDRETFNFIVRDAATKRREQYKTFLKSVPILDQMNVYELGQLCDALIPEEHEDGCVVVRQGASGDKFFLVEDGACVATKVYVAGSEAQVVQSYKAGDYFGELALLSEDVRAATVTTKGKCRLLAVDRETFKALFGPLEDVLRRNAAANYR
uniref:Cyclic nucleotide-binding domain-containing protein n=1 Tax=Noctiluca scintillans TaxID=2966 RepID=A0A7S1A8W9_NOCSC